jgi:hypothetical protein
MNGQTAGKVSSSLRHIRTLALSVRVMTLSLRPSLRRKQLGDVNIESRGDSVQRFQGGIGLGNLERTDKRLTNVGLIGEVVLRP